MTKPKAKPARRYTVDDIMGWFPCLRWGRDMVERKFNGRKTITALDVARMKISDIDALWTLERMMAPWDQIRALRAAGRKEKWMNLVFGDSTTKDDKAVRLACLKILKRKGGRGAG